MERVSEKRAIALIESQSFLPVNATGLEFAALPTENSNPSNRTLLECAALNSLNPMQSMALAMALALALTFALALPHFSTVFSDCAGELL